MDYVNELASLEILLSRDYKNCIVSERVSQLFKKYKVRTYSDLYDVSSEEIINLHKDAKSIYSKYKK